MRSAIISISPKDSVSSSNENVPKFSFLVNFLLEIVSVLKEIYSIKTLYKPVGTGMLKSPLASVIPPVTILKYVLLLQKYHY